MHLRVREGGGRSIRSFRWTADRIPKEDIAATEPALLEQLEIQPHTSREEPLSAADNHWGDPKLDLVDKSRFDRLRGESRP